MSTYKTINNIDLSLKQIKQEITLSGWVHRRRDHGGVIFIDLRDRSGNCQVVFRPEVSKKAHLDAQSLRSEFVIKVKGNVIERTKENINTAIKTGEVELEVHQLTILSKSLSPVFPIDSEEKINEDIRLKYRFLDLRRNKVRQNLLKRHAFLKAIRQAFDDNSFIEIETPILNKTTPEGARDFIVPSRLNPQDFYALPQSPQIFKQLLMVSGLERYYQIAKCFRDEDLRADRQPEFTQIDLEISFMQQDEILNLVETIFLNALQKTFLHQISPSLIIEKMTYQTAIKLYGTDRPDTRFEMHLLNPQPIIKECGFKVFKTNLSNSGIVRMICVKQASTKLSRKHIDDLTTFVSKFGAKGLAWMKVQDNKLQSNITKFFTPSMLNALITLSKAENGDILFFISDKAPIVYDALANLRLQIAKKLDLINSKKLNFLWITDFPLLTYNEKEKKWDSFHHPFTMPQENDIPLLETNPASVKSQAYDLVLNGIELGGGSIRIHDSNLQKKIFSLLNLSDKDIKEKFGFFLNALNYGTPPHGGIAFGLDRIIAIMQETSSIRDVIAFPKTQKGHCLMSETPSKPTDNQLLELGISFPKFKNN